MRIRHFASLLCLTALVAAPACGGDDPPGSLVVPFSIGAGVSCSTLGVTEVTVELWSRPSDGSVQEQIDAATVVCDEGQAVFNGLPAGRYEIRASGVDDEGVVVVDNGGKDPVDVGEVTSGTENTADDVNMSTTPARILVRWQLNGGFGQCTDVPATDFIVGAYENGGASLLHEHSFLCDPTEAPVDGYNLVVDEGRDVEGDELELITIDPVDKDGMSLVVAPLRFAMTPPGHGRTVKLTGLLNCMGDTCELTCGKPDPMDAMNCLPD